VALVPSVPSVVVRVTVDPPTISLLPAASLACTTILVMLLPPSAAIAAGAVVDEL